MDLGMGLVFEMKKNGGLWWLWKNGETGRESEEEEDFRKSEGKREKKGKMNVEEVRGWG